MPDDEYEPEDEEMPPTHKDRNSNVSAASQLEILSVINATHTSLLTSLPHQTLKIPEKVQRPYLRGSDMPLCPLKLALDTVREKPRVQYNTMLKEFYTSTGHAIHELIQKWLGVAKLMYGKWKCPECKTLYPVGSTEKDNLGVLGPVVCKCSELPIYCDYVEFNPHDVPKTGKYNGHCDGLLMIHDKYIVLEIKTTDTAKVAKRRQHGPDPKHELQAQSYRYVMPKFLDIPEERWHNFVLLWYFDRADPRNHAILCMPYDYENFEEEIRKFVTTMKAIASKQYSGIKGTCRKEEDNKYCPYSQICFSPSRDALIEEILPGYSCRSSTKTKKKA